MPAGVRTKPPSPSVSVAPLPSTLTATWTSVAAIRVTPACWSNRKLPCSVGALVTPPSVSLPPITRTLTYGPAGRSSVAVVAPIANVSVTAVGIVLIDSPIEPPGASANPIPGRVIVCWVTLRWPATPAGVISSWPDAWLTSRNVVPPLVSRSSELPAWLWIATLTTPSPPCSSEKSPVSVWPAIARPTFVPLRRTWRVAARVSTSAVSSAEKLTPGTSSATVPVKLPNRPAGSSVNWALPWVSDARPPARLSEALPTVICAEVALLSTETSPLSCWPARVSVTPVAAKRM
jgi:hypothetical protein